MTIVGSILIPLVALPWYIFGFVIWVGYVIPTIASGVIFGGTPNKWILKKIMVQAGCALFCILAGLFVIVLFR